MENQVEFRSASIWWRDLYTIHVRQDNLNGSFWGEIKKKVGNGFDTQF
jgi:hypothetical protein